MSGSRDAAVIGAGSAGTAAVGEPSARAGAGGGTEWGAGTVLMAGLAAVLLIFLAAVLLIVQAAVGASRAATAADLAALAGADAARELIPGQPCSVAADVAIRHHCVLVGCLIEGKDQDIVEIKTSIDLPGPWGNAEGHSRAGPPP
ncbi:flp pilus-assembly TadE/G-like family protein [Paeniglutamicibacter antarcticus]|uniref:Flp pilus-assembly TadE/G-like family protein n=1 Tax=Arthrobacter terrae TaxID=2935737 RepID=A0A931CLN7_9MICC|nr:Rv3654c family TadE-like protein [Arthrobacter terrae]MBG0738156.1 flp pilus-assembly TadE/G-like family protein [Arthrobacter terrae]